MRPTKQLFRHWARCRDGTIPRVEMLGLMGSIREEINRLLLRGVFSGNWKLKGMCVPLYHHREKLWTFMDVEGKLAISNLAAVSSTSRKPSRHNMTQKK